MGEIKQVNIKNRTYYFDNDFINLDEFDRRKIKVDRKNFNGIDIYHLGYEYKKKIEEGDNVWYLIISGDENFLRIFSNTWKSIRTKIEENTGGVVQYDKDYMRIKFKSNDNLPTDNTANMYGVIIIIRSVFAQNGKFYPQLFLDDALYEL